MDPDIADWFRHLGLTPEAHSPGNSLEWYPHYVLIYSNPEDSLRVAAHDTYPWMAIFEWRSKWYLRRIATDWKDVLKMWAEIYPENPLPTRS